VGIVHFCARRLTLDRARPGPMGPAGQRETQAGAQTTRQEDQMIAEDRAAIVAWQLLGGRASIEWFRSELERQTTPAWNRAVAAIAGAIRVPRLRPGRWQPRPSSGAGRTKAKPGPWPRGPRRPSRWATSLAPVRSAAAPPWRLTQARNAWAAVAGKTHARLLAQTESPGSQRARAFCTDATQSASSEASGTYQCWQSTRGSLGFLLRPAQTDG
jgi:hypothetical protein